MIYLILRPLDEGYLYNVFLKDRYMKRFLRIFTWITGFLLLIWLGLTLWVQRERTGPSWTTPVEDPRGKALILYNPDPIYNLDQQLAEAFTKGLLDNGWESSVIPYADLETSAPLGYDLYVVLANTYNWAPDRPTRSFVRNSPWLKGKNVVAITLGSGDARRSERLLKEELLESGARLIDARTYWLLRPNDETRLEMSNVVVAREQVRGFAGEVIGRVKEDPPKN